MAGITLAMAEIKLAQYLDAESKVLAKQSYSLLGRTLTLANLSEIRAGIETWDQRVKTLDAKANGRGRSVNASPNW